MSDITTNATNRRSTAENTVASQTGVKLIPQASSPLSGNDRGIFIDTTTDELFYRDSSGNLTQITDAGFVSGGGGGAGIITTESTISSDFTITSGYPNYQNTGHSVVINTIANERVLLSFTGAVSSISGGSTIFLGYTVDNGATIPLTYEPVGSGSNTDFSFCTITAPLTAGPHTINLQIVRSAAFTGNLNGTAGGMSASAFQAIQYRGGLIPVKESGVSIVDKPTATDFDDHMFNVVANGTDALVKGNRKYIKTAVSMITAGEAVIGVTSTAAARTITISSADIAKGSTTRAYEIIIKDESGGAGSNNITIDTQGSEFIDGAESILITSDYGVLKLYSDGTNLWTL